MESRCEKCFTIITLGVIGLNWYMDCVKLSDVGGIPPRK